MRSARGKRVSVAANVCLVILVCGLSRSGSDTGIRTLFCQSSPRAALRVQPIQQSVQDRSATTLRQSVAGDDDEVDAAAVSVKQQPKGAVGRLGLAARKVAGWLSADGQEWVVPVEAWIYRKNSRRHSKRMTLCRKLMMELWHGIKDWDEEGRKRYEWMGRFVFRAYTFRGAVHNEQLEVQFDGEDEWRPLPPTDRRGRTQANFAVPLDLKSIREGSTSLNLDYKIRLLAEQQEVQSTALLQQPEGILVISDIDDTVKVTEVYKGESQVVRNTFVNEFESVPGMAQLFSTWESDLNASFAFVSNSPFEFQEPLAEFLTYSGFPSSTLHLRPLKTPKDQRAKFKPDAIESILKNFPQRRVILVGDSGERDPYIYADILRNHPQQIAKIFIRQVDASMPVNAEAFDGLPLHLWQVFQEPAEVELPLDLLQEQGMLTE
mmetsp:Transcript_23429/g.54102  ORF Transcript_23429/g.54102 Transcript_23429/m.54102 type:complete len:435 (+) Transcript_23429:94-1398(+)